MVKSRVMREIVNGGTLKQSGVEGEAPSEIPQGWDYLEVPTAGISTCYLFRFDDFDLQGHAVDEMTVFPLQFLVQDLGEVSGVAGTVERVDILSCKPLTQQDFIDSMTALQAPGYWQLPASPNSSFSLEDIFQGTYSKYQYSSDYTGLTKMCENSWGSGRATARNKMFYCTVFRWLMTVPSGQAFIQFEIPSIAYVVPSNIDQEPDLEYLMRLKRSYDVQERV